MAFMGIPVALDLARRAGAPAIYDARDIYLDSTNLSRLPGPLRSLLFRRERRWARRADRVITVNDGCADLLEARFGVPRPLVILNASPRRDAPLQPGRRFHDLLDLAPETRIVLYQGGFMPNRGLDVLLQAIPLVPQAHLVLLGFGPLRDELIARAAEPASGGRIHVLPAVPPEELADWVVSADVGVMPNQPRTLNERLSTPNKLFESLAVGLPVVSSDFPERRRIVIDDPDGPLGAVCDPTDPVALGAAIRSILDLDPAARADLRARCLRAAHERWNWETESARLVGLYAELAEEIAAGPSKQGAGV
jgi:glycosyltransferase involved in cell wall biosynthesis